MKMTGCGTASLYGSMLALATGLMVSPVRAEGLDRIYDVQARLSPTALVAGTGASAVVDTLGTRLGPNIRQKQELKAVSIGQGNYRLGQYRMRVRLHHGPNGGYDDGTLSYVVSASLSRMAGDHTASIFTRVKGVLKLHGGEAAGTLPANRYFTGTVQIRAVAARLF